MTYYRGLEQVCCFPFEFTPNYLFIIKSTLLQLIVEIYVCVLHRYQVYSIQYCIFVYALSTYSTNNLLYMTIILFPFSWKTWASLCLIENCNIPFHFNVCCLDRLGNLLIGFYKSRLMWLFRLCHVRDFAFSSHFGEWRNSSQSAEANYLPN